MNRTDRLLAIILELQGRGNRRGADLAATFEVSVRTIYRDIEALCEAGVPVIAVPGRGYSLVKGYFLPPLTFSSDEAVMLLLGSDVMAQEFDAEYQAAAQSASRKIAGVLPEALREEVGALQESIRFIRLGSRIRETQREMLQLVRRAIGKQQTVRFEYYARHTQGERTVREADPYGLAHIGGNWYMVAYCHTRQGIRSFRLSRIGELQVTEKTFARPPGFRLQREPDSEQQRVTIVALFDNEVARWVEESPSYFMVEQEKRPDGLLITLRAREESNVLHWLLSWGRHVHVLEPESLRRTLAEEAQAISENHQKSVSLLT